MGPIESSLQNSYYPQNVQSVVSGLIALSIASQPANYSYGYH